MNIKQKRFADEYLIDLNATQAAIRAGYSEATASEIGYKLVHNSSVAAYIAERGESIATKLGLSVEYVLGTTKDIIDKTKPLRHSENASVAMKGLDLVGKHLKLWDNDDKKQQSVTINIVEFKRDQL